MNNTAQSKYLITPKIILIILLFLLGLWGCLTIYNANALGGAPYSYVLKQLVWFSVGTLVMYVLSVIPFEEYKQRIIPISIVSYLSLICVFFLGTKINGMQGWFKIGNYLIQPSEFAKVPFIMLLCWAAEKNKNKFPAFLCMLGISVAWVIPVMLQPDFGTALIFVSTFLLIHLITSGKLWHLLVICVAGIPLLLSYVLNYRYVVQRILGFIDPLSDPTGNGWHIRQFQYTLARGGVWGESLGKALWSNSYLPLAHTDSAFASLTESVGCLGALSVIIIYLAVLFLCYRLSLNTTSNLRKNIIFSIGGVFVLQGFLHISVNVAMVPPTGVTLPLISYGGSSMLSTLIGFGILFSALRTEKEAKNLS